MNDTQQDSAAMIGARLGSYRLDSELGSGGMGTVFRATHEVLGRSAAVKLLRAEMSTNPELVTRFINEAKAASAIRHPGIIEVFDFGETEDGRAYLVMEFLDGESLGQRIARHGRLSETEAARIARGIASALTAAHDKGIVHRDLKPDNIFLVADPDVGERAKVLDFGIAKLTGPTSVKHTQTGALMGTPLYMAPEQARAAGSIDRRADLYSLGCMLYEMVVGQPPFVAVGAGEIIALQLFGNVEPPTTRGAAISAELDAVIMRLLQKEPRDRFQTAAEVSDALGAVLSNHGVRVSTPPPLAYPAPRLEAVTHRTNLSSNPRLPVMVPSLVPEPRRNTLPIIAGAILIVLAGVGAGVFFMTRSDPAPAPTAAPAPAPAPPAATPPAVGEPPVAPAVEAAPTEDSAPSVKPVKQPTPVKKRPTTKKGSPYENSID